MASTEVGLEVYEGVGFLEDQSTPRRPNSRGLIF